MKDQTETVQRVRATLNELKFSLLWKIPTPTGVIEVFVHRQHAGQVILQTLGGPGGVVMGWDVFVIVDRSNVEEVTLENLRKWTASFTSDKTVETTRTALVELHERLSKMVEKAPPGLLAVSIEYDILDDLKKLVDDLDGTKKG